MVRHDRDERRLEQPLAPQAVDQIAQAIVDEPQRRELGDVLRLAVEPASGRRAGKFERMMPGRHVVNREKRMVRTLAALARRPVEHGRQCDAFVDAPGVVPRRLVSRQIVAVQHHIETAVLQKPDLPIEREIGGREQRRVVAGRFQGFRHAHAGNRRIHLGDGRIVRIRQLRAPDVERRLHRLRPVGVVRGEEDRPARALQPVEERHWRRRRCEQPRAD